MQWSEMEATLEADVALLRSQLNALPIWDPDLQMRLRQQGTAWLTICFPRWLISQVFAIVGVLSSSTPQELKCRQQAIHTPKSGG